MKTQSPRRKDGFTLVELLVVIAIIAVLAGAGFAAGNAAIQRAKRMTCLNNCTGLEQAVNAFYTEYGALPKENMTSDETIKTDVSTGTDLLKVLLGKETIQEPLNPRAISFLSVREGKAGKNGIIYSNNVPTYLYDPWGGGYNVRLDGDYDEVIVPDVSAGGAKITLNGKHCAVWSNGADAVKGSGGKAADDVKTWQ